MLWRCADCFENGTIKPSDFHKLLASLLGATVDEVKLLEESDGLTQTMTHSQCLEEDGKANIRKLVQHCFRRKDGHLPLEDESWDHLLFKKLRQALGLENEVASHACMLACLHYSCSAHDDWAVCVTLVLTLVDGMGEGRTCRGEKQLTHHAAVSSFSQACLKLSKPLTQIMPCDMDSSRQESPLRPSKSPFLAMLQASSIALLQSTWSLL